MLPKLNEDDLYPAYLEAYKNGSLARAAKEAFSMLECCSICPRRCRVNRLKDEEGYCRSGLKARICSFMPHHGEEPPISGVRGSGTIFFSRCNMRCIYCQNYEFSQLGEGKEVDTEELADIMLQLQEISCHNLNLVTPTHLLPQILKALEIAIPKGFNLPLVYNTGGYELVGIIKLLNGIVDIYLPDMRYGSSSMAIKYSDAPDYPKYNQESLREMHKQVGIANMDSEGIIRSGLIIRHLVLPNNIAETETIMKFIAEDLSRETYISLMSQYFPCFKARSFKEIARRINYEEYEGAKKSMEKYGLYNGWIQESGTLQRFAGTNIKPNL